MTAQKEEFNPHMPNYYPNLSARKTRGRRQGLPRWMPQRTTPPNFCGIAPDECVSGAWSGGAPSCARR